MKIDITYLDGKKLEAKVIPFDMVQLERNYEITAVNLEADGKVEHVLYLAWVSLKRIGQVSLSFDEWSATVEDIDAQEEAASGKDAEEDGSAQPPSPSGSSPDSPPTQA